ncbi:MAG: 2-phospho-L-lactate transferase [Candidatus Hodarchaeales archaeon]
MSSSSIVFLSGGTATPKLLQGTHKVTDARNITIIGNTGDDWDFYGLYVSPDIDSILLTLANLIDTDKWWGIKEDTFKLVQFLKEQLKEEVWFNLGDLDAGLCIFRSDLLKQGKNLTEATDIIRKRLDIQSRVLPMANQPIQTQVLTSERTMHLQEFWVKYKGKPQVLNVFFEGNLEKTTPQVINAIQDAEIIIIGPSNPVSSIGPILANLPLREALQKTSAYRIAISPIIEDRAFSGPTASFLKSWKRKVSPIGVVELYKDILDGFIIHDTDEQFKEEIESMGISPIVDDIYIQNKADASRLFKRIMDCK